MWMALVAVLVTSSVAADDDRPLVAGREVRRPARIRYAPPDLSVAEAYRVQGLIFFELTLDAEGRPTHAKVLRGIPILDPSAIEALKRWRYEPTLVDGAAKRVVLVDVVEFSLGPMGYSDDCYVGFAKNSKESTDVRLWAISCMEQLPPKKRKRHVKTLTKLQTDNDAFVAKAATAALASIQALE
jgi:TonB family protein